MWPRRGAPNIPKLPYFPLLLSSPTSLSYYLYGSPIATQVAGPEIKLINSQKWVRRLICHEHFSFYFAAFLAFSDLSHTHTYTKPNSPQSEAHRRKKTKCTWNEQQTGRTVPDLKMLLGTKTEMETLEKV